MISRIQPIAPVRPIRPNLRHRDLDPHEQAMIDEMRLQEELDRAEEARLMPWMLLAVWGGVVALVYWVFA